MIQNTLVKYFGSIGTSLILGSVLIVRNDIFDGLILSKYLYFNELISIFGIVLGLNGIFKISKISLRIGFFELFLVTFLSYIVIHALIFETIIEPKFCSQIVLIILFFIGKQYFDKPENKISLMITILIFLVFGLYEGLLGGFYIYENYKNFNPLNLRGSFHNSGIYAIYLSVPFVLSVIIFLQNKSKSRLNICLKILSVFTFILLGFVLIYTQSRTAWIASFLGILFLATQYLKVLKRFNQIVRSNLLRIIFFLLILGSILLLSKQLYEFKQNSAIGRILVWKVSLEMVKERPICGKGFNNFSQTYDNYQSNYFNKPRDLQEVLVAGKVQYAFNDYLQIMVEYGFVGIFLFLGMIFFVFYDHTNIYQGLLITCLIAGLSSYPLQGLPTSLNFYFVLMFSSLGSKKNNTFTLKIIQTKLLWIMLICVSIFIFTVNFSKDKIEKACYVAEQYFNTELYPEAIKKYKILYPEIEKDAPNLMIYAKALALDGQHQEAIKVYEQALKYLADPFLYNNSGLSYQAIGDLKKAEMMYQKSSRMIPNLIYPRYLLANLYIQNKEFDKATIIAREIVNLPVKIYSEASNEMKKEMTDFLQSNHVYNVNNPHH